MGMRPSNNNKKKKVLTTPSQFLGDQTGKRGKGSRFCLPKLQQSL